MNNMMEPKIRFKGFEGEWKEEELSHVCSVNRGVRVTRNDLHNNGIYPVYQNTDYPMGYYTKFNVLSNNPFVIVGGSAGLIGFCHTNFWAADDCVYFGDNPIINKSFLYNNLVFHKTEIKRNVRGASVPRLDRETLRKLPISMPSLLEQQAIASYFTSLDSQISAATSRLASLKQMKAASLQAMFPQEGETVPKIRFKGFEGEWKKVKLGDIAKFSKGQGYSKSDLKETGHPIILYGRMYTKYQFAIDEVDTFANLKDASILSEGNEIIMPASGETPEDIACASAVLAKDIILGGDLNIMHFDLTKFSTPFIALVITYSKTHHDLSKCAQGKSVVHLHNGAISKATIPLTSLAEQQAIASYFTSLDRQISLQSQRLEKLKQIKSACLDKMFV